MRLHHLIISLAVLPLLALSTISCGKQDPSRTPDEEKPEPVREMKYIDASSRKTWTYVSLAKGEVVEVKDPAKDLSWDVAFHRNDIRINGAEGFSGKGGAVQTDLEDFDKVSLKGLTFVGNILTRVTVGFTLGTFETTREPQYALRGKKDPRAYRTYIMRDDFLSNPGVIDKMYDLQDKVLIVRGADGKECYKLKFTGFKTRKGGSGGISFKYARLSK